MKSITPLTIDEEVKRKAKGKLLNMSAIAEEAIRKKLGEVEVLINTTIETCEFCGREGEKATRDNLEGLTWLYPDERWICEGCLKDKSRRVNAN